MHSSATSTCSSFHGSFAGIAFGDHLHLAAADIHPIAAGADGIFEATVDAVVFQKMRVGGDRAQIVDGNDLQIVAILFMQSAQHEASDAAETVDRNLYRHSFPLNVS